MSDLFREHRRLTIRQEKEWIEIVIDWETRNRYAILDQHGRHLGVIAERADAAAGFLKRVILGSHRPFDISVVDRSGAVLMRLKRKFFILFSDLDIVDGRARLIGQVRRRFSVIHKRYDLVDNRGHMFARVRSPRWRSWTFPVLDLEGAQQATVSKKWGGALRELYTDADTYVVDFGSAPWTVNQRATIFAAAISIDFDFFENNQPSGDVDLDADDDLDFDFD